MPLFIDANIPFCTQSDLKSWFCLNSDIQPPQQHHNKRLADLGSARYNSSTPSTTIWKAIKKNEKEESERYDKWCCVIGNIWQARKRIKKKSHNFNFRCRPSQNMTSRKCREVKQWRTTPLNRPRHGMCSNGRQNQNLYLFVKHFFVVHHRSSFLFSLFFLSFLLFACFCSNHPCTRCEPVVACYKFRTLISFILLAANFVVCGYLEHIYLLHRHGSSIRLNVHCFTFFSALVSFVCLLFTELKLFIYVIYFIHYWTCSKCMHLCEGKWEPRTWLDCHFA